MKNNFGLPQRTIDELISYFKNKPEIELVKIFGSRAKNTSRNGSDIDFAIWSNDEERKSEPTLREDGSDINEPVYCSFCGRPNSQVVKMVKGPGVNICSECTMIAVQYLILNDRMPSAEAQAILDAFWGKCR